MRTQQHTLSTLSQHKLWIVTLTLCLQAGFAPRWTFGSDQTERQQAQAALKKANLIARKESKEVQRLQREYSNVLTRMEVLKQQMAIYSRRPRYSSYGGIFGGPFRGPRFQAEEAGNFAARMAIAEDYEKFARQLDVVDKQFQKALHRATWERLSAIDQKLAAKYNLIPGFGGSGSIQPTAVKKPQAKNDDGKIEYDKTQANVESKVNSTNGKKTPVGWFAYRHNSPEFSLDFPSRPNQDPDHKDGLQLNRDGVEYRVAWFEIPEGRSISAQDMQSLGDKLSRTIAGSLKNSKSTTREVQISGHLGMETTFSHTAAGKRVQSTIRVARIAGHIWVIGASKTPIAKKKRTRDAETFLNSFQVGQ